METLRFADPATAAAYPLPVHGPVPWASTGAAGTAVSTWTGRLPRLEAGRIIAPGFSYLPVNAGHYVWRLFSGKRTWSLQPVPSADRPGTETADGAVSCHIDCFHIHETIEDARLELQLNAPPPERYLLTVSLRPIDLPDVGIPDRAAGLRTPPPSLTQMAADPAVARRICSPTCVAMVMAYWDIVAASGAGTSDPTVRQPRPNTGIRDAMVAACHDPATGMYGVWPLALRAAAGLGRLGAVELFADWEAPLTVLAAGIPLVTSIRFGTGQLAGAPLEKTGGHLVVVHAAAPDYVDVNDPAAADGAVQRRYAAAPFSRAWLSHRGAAYILLP